MYISNKVIQQGHLCWRLLERAEVRSLNVLAWAQIADLPIQSDSSSVSCNLKSCAFSSFIPEEYPLSSKFLKELLISFYSDIFFGAVPALFLGAMASSESCFLTFQLGESIQQLFVPLVCRTVAVEIVVCLLEDKGFFQPFKPHRKLMKHNLLLPEPNLHCRNKCFIYIMLRISIYLKKTTQRK